MKINQIIINELSESAQPGVATTTAQTPQAQAAAQAIQKGLEKLQQQSPGLDHSFNTTTAIQEILPDGTVVMDSNLQPSALQNVRKILALGGGANFKVSMSYQGIPSAASMSTAQPQPGVAEGHRPFRGVGGAFNRGDDERHDLDPTDWYIVKDGKMLVASIYPRQVQQAIAQGFSRTRAQAQSRADSQGVAEGSTETTQQQQVRAAITKGMEKWNQNGLATYQSQPAKSHYFASSDWASGQLKGINSIDPDGTVVIELNDTTTAGLVKKLASLGGMPGVKTRQLKMTFDPAKMKNGVIPGDVSEDNLNELDMFAPRTVYFKMGDGNYIKADYRGSETMFGGGHKENDQVNFTSMSWVSPNTARSLGLDKTLAKGSDPNDTGSQNAHSIVSPQYVGQAGPWGQRSLDVVDFINSKEDTVPSELKTQVAQWVEKNRPKAQPSKQGVAEAGNANSGRRGPNFQDNSPAIPGRVEPLPQGLKHHADASRYGGTKPDDEDDRLLGPAQRHRLHQAVTPDDWFDESQEKIAGRHDPDDFDNMVGRLKQLAGAGPLKTVWDPARRVYRNVPHAVQPPQQPKKAKQ